MPRNKFSDNVSEADRELLRECSKIERSLKKLHRMTLDTGRGDNAKSIQLLKLAQLVVSLLPCFVLDDSIFYSDNGFKRGEKKKDE